MHSLHAYFLRRGDFNSPIVYEVDRAWDGKHFATRRVVAIQNGQQIFNMSASFQIPEAGLDHQLPMPDVPHAGNAARSRRSFAPRWTSLPPAAAENIGSEASLRIQARRAARFHAPEKRPPLKYVWIRAVDKLPDDEALHRCLLAYASDFQLLDTALKPHALSMVRDKLVIASIDHAMWFHRSVRVDDWLLYAMDSPSASGARGFTRGSVFARDGRLVASVAQEGLIRVMT